MYGEIKKDIGTGIENIQKGARHSASDVKHGAKSLGKSIDKDLKGLKAKIKEK